LDGMGGDPGKVAILPVDVTSGFCSEGPLSSERVGGIVDPIARLLRRAFDLGIRHFILPQDTHSENALEFSSFPPHCVRGTEESETVPELLNLPFSDRFLVIEKESISSSIGTELDAWLANHPEVTTFLVVGDCTDFCVYQLAMHLRLRANALTLRDVRVIVPIDGVDTFDIPVEVAEQIGAMPHHGDLMHLVFLFSMAQNGIEIVQKVV
jgi:nicotinamidase-related amidase